MAEAAIAYTDPTARAKTGKSHQSFRPRLSVVGGAEPPLASAFAENDSTHAPSCPLPEGMTLDSLFRHWVSLHLLRRPEIPGQLYDDIDLDAWVLAITGCARLIASAPAASPRDLAIKAWVALVEQFGCSNRAAILGDADPLPLRMLLANLAAMHPDLRVIAEGRA